MGHYLLIDRDQGILTVAPDTLARIWWLITGRELYADSDAATPAPPTTAPPHNGGWVAQVKAAWPTLKVFIHFGRTGNGQQAQRDETRILGKGGLLVNDWRWYCHAEGVGGDQIDAWHYCTTGRILDRHDKRAFVETVTAMAQAAGIAPSSLNHPHRLHLRLLGPMINYFA